MADRKENRAKAMHESAPNIPPKSRGDLSHFYFPPHEAGRLALRVHDEVLHAVEQAATKANRTFNQQLAYVLQVCLGLSPVTADDERSAGDWQALLDQIDVRLEEDEPWVPLPKRMTFREGPRPS